jgi:hypothetical protein
MNIRLSIDSRNRWSFHAEPEEDRGGLSEDREGIPIGDAPLISRSVLGRLWRWLSAEYQRVRRVIETSERLAWGRRLLERLEARRDPSEPLLRQMRTAPEIVLLHPEGLSASLVRRRFLRFLRRRARAHTRGIALNVVLLPVTAAMAILPGPNVFFAWNAYRLITHILARQGARRVLRGECPLRMRSLTHASAPIRACSGEMLDRNPRAVESVPRGRDL